MVTHQRSIQTLAQLESLARNGHFVRLQSTGKEVSAENYLRMVRTKLHLRDCDPPLSKEAAEARFASEFVR